MMLKRFTVEIFERHLTNNGLQTIAPDTVNISAYYVDQDIGEELYERLKNITQFNLDNMRNNANGSDGTNSQHLARVTLYSGNVSGSTTTWQYTLITIGVVLIASVLTSGK